MQKNAITSRFILLDSLRGIAALAVASFHIYFYKIRIFNGIPIAVDFFFVLSGFVLARSLLDTKREIRKFIKSRILRLYPAILVSFSIIVVTKYTFLRETSTGDNYDLKKYILAFFLLQVFIPNLYTICVPLWSLSAELVTNICASFIVTSKKVFPIYLLIVFGFFMEFLAEIDLFFNVKLSWVVNPNYSGIGRAFVGFGLGVLLYVNRNQKSIYSMTRSPNLLILMTILVFLSVEYFLVVYQTRYIYFAAPIFYFLIRYIVSVDETIFSPRLLTFGAYLGRISYGVYVFHYPISQLISGNFLTKYLNFNLLRPEFLILGFLVKILVTCLVAEFSLRFVEMPIRRKFT
jgi:peptidoglycan/LPS O-acetylase OafA/YrhL